MTPIIVERAPVVVTPPPQVRAVRGLGAHHTWTAADGTQIVLGDSGAWPRYRLTKIHGRHGKPAGELVSDPSGGAIGEVPRRTPLAAKTEAWEGVVEGRTLTELALGRDALVEAMAENTIGRMTIAGHTSYADGPWYFDARCEACDVPDEQTRPPWESETGGWERLFTLALRMHDPRYYGQEGIVVLSGEGPVVAFPTGGLMVPFTPTAMLPDLAPAARPYDAPDVPGKAYVWNPGKAPTDPVIEVYDPVGTVTITNESLGKRLVIPATPGVPLTIDFAARRCTQRASLVRVDSAVSDWWDSGAPGLRKGMNVITLTNGRAGQMAVSFRAASYG